MKSIKTMSCTRLFTPLLDRICTIQNNTFVIQIPICSSSLNYSVFVTLFTFKNKNFTLLNLPLWFISNSTTWLTRNLNWTPWNSMQQITGQTFWPADVSADALPSAFFTVQWMCTTGVRTKMAKKQTEVRKEDGKFARQHCKKKASCLCQ